MRPTRMLTGPGVLRVVWLPGSDRLLGTCHCGAETVADDPVDVWNWLLGHPRGHDQGREIGPVPSVSSSPANRAAALSGSPR
ncbi:MAG: hypothetical protein L0I76_07730 [Pseudonocardia sp.]|nr:hypothetical protein [Pseudonocardia sp.]